MSDWWEVEARGPLGTRNCHLLRSSVTVAATVRAGVQWQG